MAEGIGNLEDQQPGLIKARDDLGIIGRPDPVTASQAVNSVTDNGTGGGEIQRSITQSGGPSGVANSVIPTQVTKDPVTGAIVESGKGTGEDNTETARIRKSAQIGPGASADPALPSSTSTTPDRQSAQQVQQTENYQEIRDKL